MTRRARCWARRRARAARRDGPRAGRRVLPHPGNGEYHKFTRGGGGPNCDCVRVRCVHVPSESWVLSYGRGLFAIQYHA